MLTDYEFPIASKIAIGFSGGGDSTALLSLVLKHAPKGMEIHALIVDHALRVGSGREAVQAQKRAVAMGAKAQVLLWRGQKPTTGIQEKARIARYSLMGDACRELGIETLLLGHNQDDQAETILMRTQSGSLWRGLAGMTEHKTAPIWPALRGVKIVRPLLGQTCAALRAHNKANKLNYINDPSNENRGFMRIQMRDMLSKDPTLKDCALAMGMRSQNQLQHEKMEVSEYIKLNADITQWGGVFLKKQALRTQNQINARALNTLLLAVSGQAYFTETSKLDNLMTQMQSSRFAGATLGGVQIINQGDAFLLIRDKGMVLGRGEISPLKPMKLQPNKPQVWDGRFLVCSKSIDNDVTVLPYGHAEKTFEGQHIAIDVNIPAKARPCLPIFAKPNETIDVPYTDITEIKSLYSCQNLILERLHALLS